MYYTVYSPYTSLQVKKFGVSATARYADFNLDSPQLPV